MSPKNSVIIDTDPGTDDVLTILLALAAPAEDLEVLLLSITYGNVGRQHCLKNAVTLLNVIHREMEWRATNEIPLGFASLLGHQPIIAVGADHPLEDDELAADFFHGQDGLHGVHEQHPHLTPDDAWETLFKQEQLPNVHRAPFYDHFTPSREPSHKEMLRFLRDRPANTVSIVVIGPMTNVALAAAEDAEAFLRVKEVIVMGGAILVPGNITPVAEFNTFADPIAAARVFALTSPIPQSTMPPRKVDGSSLPEYPSVLSGKLNLTLFPLDITEQHCLDHGLFKAHIEPLLKAGSPLAQWTQHWVDRSFEHIQACNEDGSGVGYHLHDPMTIWYLLTRDNPGWKSTPEREDIRIETTGQWTRGMHTIDRRPLRRLVHQEDAGVSNAEQKPEMTDDGGWLSIYKGNLVNRMLKSPGMDTFHKDLLSVFGQAC